MPLEQYHICGSAIVRHQCWGIAVNEYTLPVSGDAKLRKPKAGRYLKIKQGQVGICIHILGNPNKPLL